MERSIREIQLLLKDGAREPHPLEIAEPDSELDPDIYQVSIHYRGRQVVGQSERGLFFALQQLRLKLEPEGILFFCFGASEDAYPSPMAESMGSAVLVYRNTLGRPARQIDLVNSFDFDETVKPATVAQQERFHAEWIDGITKRER